MLRSLSCVVSFVGVAAAQTTWIVEAGNPAALPTVAAAVAAASDGDIIRIRDAVTPVVGTVPITKSLRILGEPALGGSTLLFNNTPSSFAVQIARHQSVTFSNLQFGWLPGYSMAVTVDHCAGRVTFQDVPSGSCTFQITASGQVLFARVTCTAATPVQIVDSVVAFSECEVTGERANYESSALAQEALRATRSTVLCTNSVFRGGLPSALLAGSLPGARAATITTSTVHVSGTSDFVHGHSPSLPPILSSLATFVLPSTLSLGIAGSATTTVADLPTVDAIGFAGGRTATLAVRSPLGTLTALVFGTPGDRLPVPGVQGDLWIDPQIRCVPLLGSQNGNLAWQVAIPPAPALFATAFRWQAAALLGSTPVLGAPGAGFLR